MLLNVIMDMALSKSIFAANNDHHPRLQISPVSRYGRIRQRACSKVLFLSAKQ